ncbi:MAG TPA: MbnP family protein [Flavitalea sp.]|nr:MbnP family protein [Flavitalea sp.]
MLLHFFASNGEDSVMESQQYNTPFNETFSVNRFRFYIHDISLINSTSNAVDPNHYLVDLVPSTSNTVNMSLPAGEYSGIRFTIGVDSIRNFSGAQTGALDPANGMFWTWNSGYIMVKLEGNSPSATTPDNKFEYHIGGYNGTESVIRTLDLPFPSGQVLFSENGSSTITIKADLEKWFNGDFQLRIATNPVISTPGELAVKMADNYRNMFSVISVRNTE